MELPQYRAPGVKSLSARLSEKLKDFAAKTLFIIVTSTIVIWFLTNFGIRSGGGFGFVEPNGDRSILAFIGNSLKLFFAPLGFAAGPDGWKAVVSALSGMVAREAVVSTMGQLYSSSGGAFSDVSLAARIGASFSLPSALSFITWNLLSVPCVSAVAAINSEMKSPKWFWGTIAFQLAAAWIVSFIVFNVASLICRI